MIIEFDDCVIHHHDQTLNYYACQYLPNNFFHRLFFQQNPPDIFTDLDQLLPLIEIQATVSILRRKLFELIEKKEILNHKIKSCVISWTSYTTYIFSPPPSGFVSNQHSSWSVPTVPLHLPCSDCTKDEDSPDRKKEKKSKCVIYFLCTG